MPRTKDTPFFGFCDPEGLRHNALASKQIGEEYLTWPQRALFDRLGIRRQVLETDLYGNFAIR